MSKPVQQVGYVPVRKTDGKEWLDVTSMHLLREEAEKNHREVDERIPSWAKVNKCQRIAKVLIVEIKDE